MIDHEINLIVKNDPETKDLNLSENDYLIAYQYILQRDSNDLKGVKPRLRLKPFVHIDYVHTKERELEASTKVLKQHLAAFESDVYISNVLLDDYLIKNPKQEKAVEYMKNFLLKPKEYQKGLFIYGPYRTGKSYLLSALANELTKRQVGVVYVFLPDLVRSLKNSISEGNLESKINILKRCDVLILDDLGGENMSSWFRDEILLPILHYRLSANLSVFISSNYNKKILVERIKLNDQTDLNALRIMQRINDLTIPIQFNEKFDNLEQNDSNSIE